MEFATTRLLMLVPSNKLTRKPARRTTKTPLRVVNSTRFSEETLTNS